MPPCTSSSCTILYGESATQILLPDKQLSDSYIFLQEKLSRGFPELAGADIEVHALGANLEGLWPPQRALRPGTYRIQLKAGSSHPAGASDNSVEHAWQPVVSTHNLDRSGYFHEAATLPQKLCLQLVQDLRPAGERLSRQPEYLCHQRMLEFPFVKHFSDAKQEGPSLRLKINPDVGLSEQRKQLEFIQTLFEMKLMLRVADFSPGRELLLLPCRSEVLGFVRNAGTVQAMAKQELENFVRDKKLISALLPSNPADMQVLVFDLDHTLVHTMEPGAVLLPDQSTRMFDVASHDSRRCSQARMCAPRANLLELYLAIKHRYTVYYLTAGEQQYGQRVVCGIREHLLADQQLSDSDRRWITQAANPEHVMSSKYAEGTEPGGRPKGFKTLGMLLKVAYVPEYARKVVVILDDSPHVWQVPSDRELVRVISQQHLLTSYGKPSAERALTRFAGVAAELSGQAFAQEHMDSDLMKPLTEVEQKVAWARHRKEFHCF